jgi:DNA mismatch repair protein MutS
VRNDYVRPRIVEGPTRLLLTQSRHPTVERLRERGQFVRNDIFLDENNRTLILTGPNMAGKSTVMRQAALAIVMAQMGSFVAAQSAELTVFDQIFTRIGASDNLTRGESTFWLEMKETAEIVAQATERSFALLDEVGRGTSHADGLAIAWAVARYITTHNRARTMFATHYPELSALAEQVPGVWMERLRWPKTKAKSCFCTVWCRESRGAALACRWRGAPDFPQPCWKKL